MNRLLSIFLCVVLTLGVLSPAARAAVNIERQGTENPVVEVAKSTLYGGLGGLLVGWAVALVSKSTDDDGDIVRWGFVGGTFFGLGYGIYHVSNRPKATAMLELQGRSLSFQAALPVPEPGHGITMRLIAVRF